MYYFQLKNLKNLSTFIIEISIFNENYELDIFFKQNY